MKNNKIKLADLKVKSFVTEQSNNIKGGAPLHTNGKRGCVAVLFTDECQPSEGCEASFEAKCAWTVGGLYCG